MSRKRKRRWTVLIAVILMLMAIWAYLASLDESEPLTETRSERPSPGDRND